MRTGLFQRDFPGVAGLADARFFCLSGVGCGSITPRFPTMPHRRKVPPIDTAGAPRAPGLGALPTIRRDLVAALYASAVLAGCGSTATVTLAPAPTVAVT